MVCSSLEEVRENIDRIDNEIIKLIAESRSKKTDSSGSRGRTV